MKRYLIVSIVSGLLFGTMDGLIHANPYAMELFEVYQSIAKTTINVPAGIVIDLVYGLVMGGFSCFSTNLFPDPLALQKE